MEVRPVMVTVPALAEQMGRKQSTILEWARREVDPLPLRYMAGERKCGCIDVEEFKEWWARNSVHYQERR